MHHLKLLQHTHSEMAKGLLGWFLLARASVGVPAIRAYSMPVHKAKDGQIRVAFCQEGI